MYVCMYIYIYIYIACGAQIRERGSASKGGRKCSVMVQQSTPQKVAPRSPRFPGAPPVSLIKRSKKGDKDATAQPGRRAKKADRRGSGRRGEHVSSESIPVYPDPQT